MVSSCDQYWSQMRINPEALRTIRTDREVSITRLAELVGMNSHSHLSNVEAGRREASPDLIRRLAAALKVDLLALLGPEVRPGERPKSSDDEATVVGAA